MTKKVKIECVQAGAYTSLYIDDHRVAGPKPWGGGRVVDSWTVRVKDIEAAIMPYTTAAEEG